MKISVILAHPKEKSLNHAIARAVVEQLECNKHEVSFHDLYKERFEPRIPEAEFSRDTHLPDVIEDHCREIAEADGVVVVHPNWWGQPPAVLKGWVDRVIRPGVAYEFVEGDSGEGVPRGLMKAKTALVFNTSNTESKREQNVFGDPLETIWKNCIFGLCGISNFNRRTFSVVVTSTEAQRKIWLDEAKQDMDRFFPCENNTKTA